MVIASGCEREDPGFGSHSFLCPAAGRLTRDAQELCRVTSQSMDAADARPSNDNDGLKRAAHW